MNLSSLLYLEGEVVQCICHEYTLQLCPGWWSCTLSLAVLKLSFHAECSSPLVNKLCCISAHAADLDSIHIAACMWEPTAWFQNE